MKTKTIMEKPIFTVVYKDYNEYATMDVYAKDLKEREIGYTFEPTYGSCCGRDVTDERLTIIYKDDKGVACRLDCYYTSDSPNPVESNHSELIWFGLH